MRTLPIIFFLIFLSLSASAQSLHSKRDTIVSRIRQLSTSGEDFGIYAVPSLLGMDIYYTSEFYDGANLTKRELMHGIAEGLPPDFQFSTSPLTENTDLGCLTEFNSYGFASHTTSSVGGAASGSDIFYSDDWQNFSFDTADFKQTGWQSHPSLSSDGILLFFASNRPGGYGGSDIWYLRRNLKKQGKWEGPFNAGPNVNTPGDEISPFLYGDMKTLYFSSNSTSLPGKGGFDVYCAVSSEKLSTSTDVPPFSKPKPLARINTEYDECFYVTKDTSCGFFCSNRPREGGSTDLDIFMVTPSPHKDPPLQTYHFQAIDCQTHKPVQALFHILEKSGDALVAQAMAQTDKEGRFTIQELPGEYTLQPALEDYVGIQIRLSTEEYPEWFEQKVILSRIGADCTDTVRLQVLFETAKYDLTPESVAALDEFVALIEQHKVNGGEVKLLAMEGHTDEHGGIDDNMTLSMHRVNTVRDYLASKLPAIASRITSTWYGKSRVIRSNTTARSLQEAAQIDAFNRRVIGVIKFQFR